MVSATSSRWCLRPVQAPVDSLKLEGQPEKQPKPHKGLPSGCVFPALRQCVALKSIFSVDRPFHPMLLKTIDADFHFKAPLGQVQWPMPIISAVLRKQRQENSSFEASLGYTRPLCLKTYKSFLYATR